MIDLNKKLNLIQGDCLQIMKELPEASIDLVVTDPPYGYSFMNKDWDKAVPHVDIWRECLRVLKCGAFAFVMSAPRSDVQAEMILKLKEAGFEVGFTPIYWAYASGFPKASNISKMVDKRLGFEQEVIGVYKTPDGRDYTLEESGKKGYNKTELSMGKNIGKERRLLTTPSSVEAKELDGLFGGFQPKPAVEIILVAMKPIREKTFVEQALKNGHGGTWLGKCRIPYANENDKFEYPFGAGGCKGVGHHYQDRDITPAFSCDDGRFPANLLVSDNVLDNGQISKAIPHEHNHLVEENNLYNGSIVKGSSFSKYNDVGGFSRYFSLDAWWEQQVKSLPKQMREPLSKTFPFIIEPKASKGEKNEGLEFNPIDNSDKYNSKFPCSKADKEFTNKHPTVKPVDLMSCLVVLGSKKGEIVLDPFVGSGTTLIAADLMNRKAIGIELNKEYHYIAKARIKTYEEQTRLF